MTVTAGGRARLRRMLPGARKRAQKIIASDDFTAGSSPLGQVTLSYVTEANLDSLEIYRTKLGGWHADVVMRNVPPGVPNTLGSPVGQPMGSREEAEVFAERLLDGVMVAALGNAGKPPPKPTIVFLYNDFAITIDTAVFAGLGIDPAAVETDEGAMARLRQLDRDYPGMHPNDMPVKARAGLSAAITVLTHHGIYAWPLRKDVAPA